MNESSTTAHTLHAKMSETRENIADTAHLAKEAVQDKLHDLADRASESYGAGKKKLRSLEDSFLSKVHDGPIKALMIAAGVGLLVGFLVRRK
jgi:ElaB/YqjD/DUF883 family membrane-anchored ribosome-binding protein